MTWQEFKEAVDEALKRNEIPETIEVFYIDTGNYPREKNINVNVSKKGLEILYRYSSEIT